MAGLLDIAPPEIVSKRFEIRGGFVEVRGLLNIERAKITRRFPIFGESDAEAVRKALSGDEELMDGLIVVVIAAGMGVCGDEETESLIRLKLNENERMALYLAVMELSSPSPLREVPVQGAGFNGKGMGTEAILPKRSSPRAKSPASDGKPLGT